VISLSLPRLPAALTSIILLAQPVATVLLARVLLDEEPSIAQLVGVALVVGGIAFATVPVGRLRDRARAALA
jgi:drug/metabolite transporter (DMT)-like permease